MQFCKERNYHHPFTLTNIKNIKKVKDSDVSFPLLIKPNITCGGRGMTLVNSYTELQEIFLQIQKEFGDCHLQKYVKQGGAQVEVQLFINEKRELINSMMEATVV